MPAARQSGRKRGLPPRIDAPSDALPVGRAPAGLGPAGRSVWRDLAALPWTTAHDRPLLEAAARLADERVVLMGLLEQDPSDWRQRNQLRSATRDYLAALSLAGATATDRARLRESPTPEDPLVRAEKSKAEVRRLLAGGAP